MTPETLMWGVGILFGFGLLGAVGWTIYQLIEGM